MKVGLSLSRCLRDIWEGKIEENDVLVIIARTDVNPNRDEHWYQLWEGYRMRDGLANPEWIDIPDEAEQSMRQLLINLYEDGKIHQPRQFKAHPPRMPYHWLECFVPDDELLNKPAVKKAWDNYKVVASLS